MNNYVTQTETKNDFMYLLKFNDIKRVEEPNAFDFDTSNYIVRSQTTVVLAVTSVEIG